MAVAEITVQTKEKEEKELFFCHHYVQQTSIIDLPKGVGVYHA